MEDIDYKYILEKLKFKATEWSSRIDGAESIEYKFFFENENVLCVMYRDIEDVDGKFFDIVYFNNVVDTDEDGEFIPMPQIISSMLGKSNVEESEKFVTVKKFMDYIDLLDTNVKFAGRKV